MAGKPIGDGRPAKEITGTPPTTDNHPKLIKPGTP